MTTIRINLLPHREMRRERRKKDFVGLIGLTAIAAGACATLVALVINGWIETQDARNAFIEAENRKLEAQIKEIATLRQEIEALKARQAAVESLQSDRTMPVHLLDELVKQTPEGIFLKSVRQVDKKVTLAGFAQSNERVSELLRNLSGQTPWLDRPELVEIKATAFGPPNNARESRRVYEFQLHATLRNPASPAEDKNAAAGPAARPPARAEGAPALATAAR